MDDVERAEKYLNELYKLAECLDEVKPINDDEFELVKNIQVYRTTKQVIQYIQKVRDILAKILDSDALDNEEKETVFTLITFEINRVRRNTYDEYLGPTIRAAEAIAETLSS